MFANPEAFKILSTYKSTLVADMLSKAQPSIGICPETVDQFCRSNVDIADRGEISGTAPIDD
jgi:hypothetical protein